jgi:hypothetical protein
MNLYTITAVATATSPGRIIDWAGTQIDAKAACEKHAALLPSEVVSWEPHEVPVDKPSLLAWLKKYAVNLGEAQVEQAAEVFHQMGLAQPLFPQLTNH